MNPSESKRKAPHVRVLLATHNGSVWLEEQLSSIAAQKGVRISVVASDDMSSDDTPIILTQWERRVQMQRLPTLETRMGNANRNFLRLIKDTPLEDAEFFALSDQDDVWLERKLRRAVDMLIDLDADAYSSNVTAFWPDGRVAFLDKAQPQRSYDHLFESAGPGCTFVFPRRRFAELKSWVTARWADLHGLKVHDWLIYAYARQHGWSWRIDRCAGLHYRQHGNNEAGANLGRTAAKARFKRVQSGAFRTEALAIADAIGADNEVVARLRRFSPTDRMWLTLRTSQLRRRWRDQITLSAFFLIMPLPAEQETLP